MASAVQCKSSRVYGLVLCPRVCQLTWNLTDKNCPTTTTYEQIVFAAASERGKTNRQVDRQTDRRTQTDKKSDNKTKRYTSKQTDSKVDTGGRTLEWVEIPFSVFPILTRWSLKLYFFLTNCDREMPILPSFCIFKIGPREAEISLRTCQLAGIWLLKMVPPPPNTSINDARLKENPD